MLCARRNPVRSAILAGKILVRRNIKVIERGDDWALVGVEDPRLTHSGDTQRPNRRVRTGWKE
jgi:hypothetical protein